MCMQNKVRSKSRDHTERKSGLQKQQVEWPRPFRSVLYVGSLKRPKHAVHDEGLGTPLMTRFKFVIRNVNQHECLLHI